MYYKSILFLRWENSFDHDSNCLVSSWLEAKFCHKLRHNLCINVLQVERSVVVMVLSLNKLNNFLWKMYFCKQWLFTESHNGLCWKGPWSSNTLPQEGPPISTFNNRLLLLPKDPLPPMILPGQSASIALFCIENNSYAWMNALGASLYVLQLSPFKRIIFLWIQSSSGNELLLWAVSIFW